MDTQEKDTNAAEIAELERNMDAVFDHIYILNTAFGGLLDSLTPAQAKRFLTGLAKSESESPNTHLGFSATNLLSGWRIRAATIAQKAKSA